MNAQIEKACDLIKSDPNLFGKNISVVGLSQGALVARSIIEQCDFQGSVKRYVSIGGPQMGVATIPQCFSGIFCDAINYVVDLFVYLPIVQNNIGPAGFFNNPRK